MKDKITIALVCTFFIGMYWISKTSSMVVSNESFNNEKTLQTLLEDTTIDYIDYETPETTLFDEAEYKTDIATMNACSLQSLETNELAFGEAFGYYRQCLGSDSSFQWRGVEYTTLLAKEVIIIVADSINVDDNSNKSDVSQIR